jgi:hypothetical protein
MMSSKKASLFSDHQIRQIAENETSSAIAEWVHSIARQCGVKVRRMPYDKFVKAVSRLSGGVVDLDPIEELLVVLGRNRIITSFQRGLLQVNYLRRKERKS